MQKATADAFEARDAALAWMLKDGYTALMSACKHGHDAYASLLARLLLDAEAGAGLSKR